jgi:hypothetical protein
MSPDEASPGNGLLLFFRVDDYDKALNRARALVGRFEEEPHVHPKHSNKGVLTPECHRQNMRYRAVAIGIRQAARQAAGDLPPNEQERFVQRAMKRCSRQKWLVKAQQDKADALVTSPNALSANVRKGADVLSEILAEDGRETRIGLSAAGRKAAETLAKMPGSKVIKHAQAHRHMTASSSVLHSWDEKGNPIPFSLNILNINSLEIDQDSPEMR